MRHDLLGHQLEVLQVRQVEDLQVDPLGAGVGARSLVVHAVKAR